MIGTALAGSTALVTGGSRGIGAACCKLLAAAGANVVVNYRRERSAAEEVAAACRKDGVEALAVGADVTLEAEVTRLFAAAEALAPLDIVVANAGTWEGGAIEEMTLPEWSRQLEQNLTSLFLTGREAARRMKPRRHGSIVVLASTAAQRGEAFHSAYAASKGAALSFVKSLATELGPHGVRINAVAPGWVMTDMARAAIEADREAILAAIPLQRVASAEDVAGPVLFLASPLARHITGEVLNVNGGSVLCG